MKRIDSVNARPDMFGTGKSGFHDNADLQGQDATYLTPDFLNTIQEELANLLEKNGIVLNPKNHSQLFELICTYPDLEFLSAAIEERLKKIEKDQDISEQELQTQINDLLEYLQSQITKLNSSLANVYPKNLKSERIYVSSNDSKWVQINPNISMSLLDTRLSIYISPEGPHEAWEISRSDSYFSVKVWHRSGTDRKSFNNYINYLIVQNQGESSSSGNSEYYYTGSEIVFPILAGESKSILLIGAGGGGGSSRYEDLANNNNPLELKGSDGQDSYFSVDGTNIKLIAGGGKGGVGGIDGLNEQFINGTSGAGGQWSIVGEIESSTRANGQVGYASANDHTGANTDSSHRGAGGNGADGFNVVTQGFGGGAGEGARIQFIYKNKTAATQYARIYVGQGGAGENSWLTNLEGGTSSTFDQYSAGGDGIHGFVRVSEAV